MNRILCVARNLFAGLLLVLSAAAHGQEEEVLGWSDVAELTYVATSGNAEAETLGFRNALVRKMDGAIFTLEAGGLRANSTTLSRAAVGDPSSFRVEETSTTLLTAESYYLRGRYERAITDRLFWFTGAGWDRNEFAGVANRTSAVAGIGHLWFDDADGHFRTDYGLTFTDQEDVFGGSDSFAGVRLGWDYLRQLSATTNYVNLLVLDANADETSDYRADMINSVAVAMSDRLALKVSLQLLFDNLPSLTAVPLVAPDREPSGSVLVPLDELDTQFNVALVVNF